MQLHISHTQLTRAVAIDDKNITPSHAEQAQYHASPKYISFRHP